MRALQAVPVGQLGERIVHREVLDPLRGVMLLGDVARGAADAQHSPLSSCVTPRVDADPAVVARRR